MQKLLHGLLFSFWILKLYANSDALMNKHFSILVFKARLAVIITYSETSLLMQLHNRYFYC